MTTFELKESLIIAHKRDRKLTLLGFSIVAIIIITLVAVQAIYKIIPLPEIDFSAITANPIINGVESFNYLKIIIPLSLLGMCIYPCIIVYKIAKRLGVIEGFIEKIEKGAIADSMVQNTVYKITIPLLKINFKLCPVEYLNITLTDDMTKLYNLPIPIEVIPESKALLSGSNVEAMNQSWLDLYGEETTNDEILTTPLKSKEAFKTFLENDLATDLAAIENERAQGKKKYILYIIPGALLAIGFMVMQYLMSTEIVKISTEQMLIGFGAFFLVFFIYIFITTTKSKSNKVSGGSFEFKFKMRIFKRMIAFINPKFQYILHGHLSLAEVLATGFLEPHNYEISGNDQIIGKHNGVPFQLCDLSLTNKRNFTSEKEGPDEVFRGQVFIAKFNKSINHALYLVPRKTSKLARKKNDIKDYLAVKGEKIILEDPEFMKLYDVYGSDQIEARFILSPTLMDRIKELAQQHPGALYISFKEDRVSILNNNQTNNFEVSMFKSLIANDLMLDFYDLLKAQMEFIEQLKLNIKIWK